MIQLLDELRQKPEPVRRKVAIFAAALLTGIILILWLFSFDFGTSSGTDLSAENKKSAELGPVSVVFKNLTDMIGDTISEVGEFKTKVFSGQTVYPAPQKKDEGSESAGGK